MQLKIFKGLWGDAEGHATQADLARIRGAGYDGIEWSAPQADPAAWRDWCGELGLEYIAMVFPLTPGEIAAEVQKVRAYGPVKITMHSGRDKMTFEEGCDFFEAALALEEDLGIPIAHETHRHRLLYAPWATARYLERFPRLRVCADFSHWCCVCESLLKDMEDWVQLTCERAVHVHGRVGWEEGPQVADPRAPEVAHYVARHEEFWDRIRAAHQQRQAVELTFTPEYGPPGYMPALPYTRQPLANLWDVCLWSAERLRTRWGA
ncbi:MAG: sugar phosphate isomerase/epimerase [Phycisphaerales bacterium]|nr:sugar phosphate isomerase/epimerase [Phycisphaerales bacterium]